MLLSIHPANPSPRGISQVVEVLKNDGLVIFPTDSVYAVGCDLGSARAFERLCRFRGIKPQQAVFSFLFADLSTISAYTRPFDRSVFKLLKAHLPGPFTFILPAGGAIPAAFRNRRKTIGIRIPDHPISREIISKLGGPLVSTSLHDSEDDITGYLTDPEEIYNRYRNQVDLVVDGGYGEAEVTTVVDCTGDAPVVTRQGKGELD